MATRMTKAVQGEGQGLAENGRLSLVVIMSRTGLKYCKWLLMVQSLP